jgi:hypothetical protein
MEPMTSLMVGLIAGATAGAKGIATQAVGDSYNLLKSKIKEYFQSKQCKEGEMALLKIEEDAETWKKPLEQSFRTTEISSNTEIIELLNRLTEAIKNSPETVQGLRKYDIKVEGGKVGIIGDNAKVDTMNL